MHLFQGKGGAEYRKESTRKEVVEFTYESTIAG
jgi:hypothetical protein